MGIDERIESISEYMLGFVYNGKEIVVNVKLPKEWDPLKDIIKEKLGVKIEPIAESPKGEYHFWVLKDAGFHIVFDAIEFVIKFNKTTQQKIKLLGEKYRELQKIFQDNNIETLETIEFSYTVKDDNKVEEITLVEKPKMEMLTPEKISKKDKKEK